VFGAPIEVFFGVIVFIFVIIGIVRGFLRELGVTLALMFLLFFLSRFEPSLDRGVTKVLDMGSRVIGAGNRNAFEVWIYIFVIGAAAFISYQGETLAFGGDSPRGSQGTILGAMTGLLNGYLIAGSIWYYMDKFNYPIQFLGFSRDRLSIVAQELISFLPNNFLGKEILFGQSLFLYFTALLFLARIIR
jgi:hypothetical protein